MDVHKAPTGHGDPVVLTVGALQVLIDRLRADGRVVIGPTVRDGVVALAEITSVGDLPAGIGDDQRPGHYRVTERGDTAFFAHAVPAASWKRVFLPPRERLLSAPAVDEPDPPAVALFGVRACDLAALRIHDHVLSGRGVVDVRYARRRAGALVIAVSCTEPAATCFCVAVGTGPEPGEGYDVRLTELMDDAADAASDAAADDASDDASDDAADAASGDAGHRFVALAGSPAGAALLAGLPSRPAEAGELALASDVVRAAAERMMRRLGHPHDDAARLDPARLRDALYAAVENPHWETLAARCLACANCTLVCPTCYCTTVEDTCDLTGARRERWRLWDSCFTADFSYLHGGSVRETTAARYRQWLTHKLAAWSDQFGSLGCVGCGRCTTWCPAGIDLLAEAAALVGTGARAGAAGEHR